MTVIWVLLGLAVVAVIWGISIYNRLVRLKTQVANGWSQIDVQLKAPLRPSFRIWSRASKDYMGYEQETLKRVIEARNSAIKANAGSASRPGLDCGGKRAHRLAQQVLRLVRELSQPEGQRGAVQQLMEGTDRDGKQDRLRPAGSTTHFRHRL